MANGCARSRRDRASKRWRERFAKAEAEFALLAGAVELVVSIDYSENERGLVEEPAQRLASTKEA